MAVPQLQLANLGEIFAQNQAKQAAMDTMQLQQAEALAARDARIEKANREKLLREKLATGEVNLQSPEGFNQLLNMGVITPDQYLNANETLAAIAKNKAQGEAATQKAEIAQQKLALDRQNIQSQIQNRTAQLQLSRAQEARMLREFNRGRDKTEIEIAQKLSQGMLAIPEEQRPAAYLALKDQFGGLVPSLFEDEGYSPEMGVVMQALANSAQSKSTGKPVAVIDPNTGQAVYVAPEQAIGKQVASTRTPGQTEEAKQRQKAIVKAEETRSEAAANAAGIIDSLNRAEQLVASGAATTGPYISKLPTLSAGTAEFEAISNQLGLEGTKLLKGAISEKENQKVQSTQPGNDRTPEANLAIIKFNSSIMQRTVERAKFDSAWRQAKGTIEGADAAWRRFTQENPVTSSDPNDLSINEQNIGNWQGYITGEGKQAQPTPSGGGQGGGRVMSFEEFMSQ